MTEALRIPADVLSQEVNGETVLLNLEGESYFALNEVGTHIWQLLKSGQSPADIKENLHDHYDVAREQLEADVDRLLEALFEAGLLSREDA
jgi:hypothetical protein